jgi:predicted negative regulator of RcsB-dependent stress response
MARKKIRKGSGRKKELEQPDEVMSALQDTYSVIERYKYWIIGSIVVAIVAVLGVSGFVSWRGSKRMENTEAFFKVFEIHLAEVVEPEEPAEGEEPAAPPEGTYPTETAKYEALAAATQGFIDEHGGGAIDDAARLLLVSAYTRLGKNEEAASELETYLADEGDSTLKPLVLENLGALKLRTGDASGAAAQFEAMQSSSTVPYFKARALVHLGDMANPVLVSAKGDKDAASARDYYQKALELLPEETEEGMLPSLTAMARHDVQVRLLLTPKS